MSAIQPSVPREGVRKPRTAKLRTALRVALALLFVTAGILHLTRSAAFLQIMPPYLPWPLALVYISGLCEILGGAAVLPVRSRRLAGYGLMVLLVAVFPANVEGAFHPPRIAGWDVPAWLAWLRLPLQPVLIAWVYWVTCADRQGAPRVTPR